MAPSAGFRVADPAFRLFLALFSELILVRQAAGVYVLAFASFPAADSDSREFTAVSGFRSVALATRACGHWSGITVAGRPRLMRDAYGVNSPGLAQPGTPCYGRDHATRQRL